MQRLEWLLPLAIGCGGGLQQYQADGVQDGEPTDSAETSFGEGLELGDLVISPDTLDFGASIPGEEVVADLILENAGEETITVKHALMDGDYVFSIDTITWPAELAGGDDIILSVRFKPLHEDSFAGTVNITTNQQPESAQIPVTGVGSYDTGGTDTGGGDTGGGGDFVVTPSSIDFGVIDVGTTATRDITLTNNGADDILLVDLFGTDNTISYSSNLTPPQIIATGSSKIVTVEFSPTADGVVTNATFEVETDPPGLSQSVAVTGEGVQNCTICNPDLSVDTGTANPYAMDDFVSVLGFEDTKSVILRNDGDMPLEITNVTVKNDTLAGCGTFSLSGAGPVTLDAYEVTTFDISYVATAVCLDLPQAAFDQNVIHILSNDPWEPDYVIELGGTGITL